MALYRGTTKLDGGGGGGATYTAGLNIQISPNNVISATDTTYIAGRGIGIENNGINARVGTGLTIGDYQDYSAIKGPCPEGFHIPTNNEANEFSSMCSTLGISVETHLFFPPYTRHINDSGAIDPAINSSYWTCNKQTGPNFYMATMIWISGGQVRVMSQECTCGLLIRPFKNIVVIPDNTWTTILDGSSIANNAGVFYNSVLGVLSISSDGVNWITIADKNSGATQVYHSGDTLSDTNRGLYYQFGNNHGFSIDLGYTTSSTKVDTTGYGPGNFYDDDVFITTGFGERWSSVDNPDIWGGVTGVVTQTNTILNTGVLSVNGQTGDVIISTTEESNTKTFYLSSTSDLVNAQAAYEWYLAGKNPILSLDDNVSQKNRVYIIDYYQANVGTEQILHFRSAKSTIRDQDLYGISEIDNIGLQFVCNDGQVTNIYSFAGNGEAGFLNTQYNYPTPYEPQYDGSPATKKYVDDNTIEYEAGPGIAIYDEFNDAQGPCQEGWHIPSPGERQALILSLNALGIDITNNNCLKTYCKMPAVFYRKHQDGTASGDVTGYYWTSKAYENGPDRAYCLVGMSWDTLNPRANGMLIRPFKNKASIPTSSWTTLIENSYGGVYYDSTSGQISITNYIGGWITIADKNLGATQVYDINYAPSDNTIGYFYQRGNNNGFPPSGNITTSSVQVDTTGYQAPNYYSDNTFIIGNLDWSSVDNKNLRGGLGLFLENAIVNTGVLSVNGQVGNVIIPVAEESNTKTFYLSSTSDLTTAQAAVDWMTTGKTAFILFDGAVYKQRNRNTSGSNERFFFSTDDNSTIQNTNLGNTVIKHLELQINADETTHIVSGISASEKYLGKYINIDGTYSDAFIPTQDYHPATKKYVDNGDTKIASAAPSNPTEGMLWYDTTNDVLKSYDGTNWNEVGGETYTAGEGIEIGTAQDYSAMRGPCPEGFHIPTYNEVLTLNSMCSTLGTTFSTHLFFPYNIHNIKNDGTQEDAIRSMYWTCEKSALDYYATVLHINNVAQQPSTSMMFCSCGIAIRPFKDVTKIPNSNWTTIFDGSNIADNAGVFYNSDLGILSISSDGINRITIADKNVGATQVYHDGDTLSDANRGLYYQFGNNYGFSWDGGYTTSSTKVDTTGYGPGNYYYDDVFITTGNNEWWSSVDNPDIWGGATGVVTLNNAIINTGVLSVNGQTGDVTVQGALNYYSEGSNTANVTVGSGNDVSSINAATTNDGVQISATKHGYATSGVKVAGPNVVVTSSDSINTTTMTLVDDNVTIATPAKTYTFDSNSTTGVARLSEVIQNDTTGTTTTVTKIWAGTEAEYNALGTHNANTIYHIY